MTNSRSNTSAAKRPSRTVGRTRRRTGTVHKVELHPESPKIRQQISQARRRQGFRAGVWLLVTFCLIGLGVTVCRQTFERNPLYGLKQVTVLTEGALTSERIVKELGLTMGMDTLLMNHREQKRMLEEMPEVKEAHVQKDLEGNLTLIVEQRRPVAWLECGRLGLVAKHTGLGCLLDESGVAIPCRVILKEYMALPVIRFEELSQVHPGAVVPDLQVGAALRLIREMAGRIDSGMTGVESIEIPAKYALEVVFRDGMRVTFGPDAVDFQLPRFDRVMREAREKGWRVATLNLLPVHNVPVTFAEPPALASNRT